MKRRIISFLIIIVLIVLGVLGYEYLGNAKTTEEGWGFSKSYRDLESLMDESDLVVLAHIPLYYDIREYGEAEKITKQAFYEAAINEVFHDRTGENFDEKSEIMVNQIIGTKDLSEPEYTSQRGMRPMKTGDYLLFLKKVVHPADGKVYYVSNSSLHLYKLRGNETFINIASDELAEITYSDLMDVE